MFLETVTALAPNSPTIPSQATAAMVCGYLIWLAQKTSKIPWITKQSIWINAVIRLVVSGIATLGISWQWSSATHQLTIGNLYFATIIAGLWHWFSQYAATHGFEKILQIGDYLNPLNKPPA